MQAPIDGVVQAELFDRKDEGSPAAQDDATRFFGEFEMDVGS